MNTSSPIKSLGLQFSRAFQIAIKTAAVFPAEHKSSERPILQSFEFLSQLTASVGQFTLGFIDSQVMLNNVLTSDPSLRPLETECTKRGVAALKFEPGLTLPHYKKLIYLFASPPAGVDAAGGLPAFLEQNPIPGLRIVPARKQNKNEQGDTIIESDSESYILARQSGDVRTPGDFLDSIDALLECGGFDPAMRAEALSGLAASYGDGSGYGVPIDIPKLAVVHDGEIITAAGSQPSGAGAGGNPGAAGKSLSAAAGQDSGCGTGVMAAGVPAVPSAGSGIQAGSAVRGTADFAAEFSSRSGSGALAGGSNGPDTFMQLVELSVQRSLAEDKGSPEKSLLSLARLLRNTGVDRILEQFPAEERDRVRALKPEQLAAEYIEDVALQLAGVKLRKSGVSNGVVVEEEVVHLLSRSLRATHTAERLAQKLAKFIHDFSVPPHVQEKIREELQWASFSATQKLARLMELTRYSNLEFRRFLEFAKELQGQGNVDGVAMLINHYFEWLDEPGARIDGSELSRVPELMQTFAPALADFSRTTADRLTRVLMRDEVSDFHHFQAANGLAALGQALAAREDFDELTGIGLALEKSKNRDRERHKKCCAAALATLLAPASIQRVIELYLAKRGDSVQVRISANLLRLGAPESIRYVIERLVGESDARNRLALVRLAGHLGSGSIDVASRYLRDERWYVVRNMCGVLAELSDPNLADHLAPALRHSDVRVQQAGLKAFFKSRDPKVALLLAGSLCHLSPQVLDEALEQLMFLKAPNAIPALEEFLRGRQPNLATGLKAIQALSVTADVAALQALSRICRLEALDIKLRRAALAAIAGRRSEIATRLLEQIASTSGPMAEEARRELAKR